MTIRFADPEFNGLEITIPMSPAEVAEAMGLIELGLTDTEPVRRLQALVLEAVAPEDRWGPADDLALRNLTGVGRGG